MTADDPRDETADWPVTEPSAPADEDAEATTGLGGGDESTRCLHAAPPPPRPRQAPVPLPQRSPRRGPPPPIRPDSGAAPEHTPDPRYPAQHGFPSFTGHPPPASTGRRSSEHRTWYLLGGTAAVAVVLVGVGVSLTRGGGVTTAGPASASRPVTPTTSTMIAPTPVGVDPARLRQVLLPADAISTTLASPGMVPGDVQTSADFTTDGIVVPPKCTSAWGPGKTRTYQLSGFLGMARQLITEQPTPNHAVVQAVLAFPDATAARKSYEEQVRTWGDCRSQTITSHLGGSWRDQTAVVGSAAEADGVATLQITPDLGLPGVACERALTVAGNVVVDVRSCSPSVGDTAGAIAREIATKIDTGR